jgi:putative peptide zinc metalloprotease protein
MSAGPTPLPQLREDLRLLPGPVTPAGTKSWLVYDPIQHRYFQVDQRTRDLLSLWHSTLTVQALIEAAQEHLQTTVEIKEIENLLAFADTHNLTLEPSSGDAAALWVKQKKSQHSFLHSMLHNYLFFRVPLFRSDRFLSATQRLVDPLFSRTAAALIAGCGIAGLYLASRQWTIFLATAANFWSWEGFAWFSVGLMFVKACHELGHAYTAKRLGCAVPIMGVAFMMMAPMLYTDVTDAWRLTARRQRVQVACAGMVVEIGLACIASLAWALLPDGSLRSIAFVVATTGWILSLAMNLNPLMRFDGYYILSDALGIENMLDRSFTLGRWKMRETLFDLKEPCPDHVSDRNRRILIAYAWAVWLYRLILFTGIALLVYHYFFKLLGIILFLVEVGYFIVRPIWRELKHWTAERKKILTMGRSYFTLLSSLLLFLVFVMPWSSHVEVPAVLEIKERANLYPLRAAEVAAVKVSEGDEISKGDTLVELVSHEVENELGLSKIKLALVEIRRARNAADQLDRDQTLVLEREFRSLKSKIAGLEAEKNVLVLRAPIAGQILELDPTLAPGRWIGRKDAIALIGDSSKLEARGYVNELDVQRISQGTQGVFIPDDPTERTVPVSVTEVAASAAPTIETVTLTAPHGGPIAVNYERGRGLVPSSANYPVRMAVSLPSLKLARSLRGSVVLHGRRESFALRMWRRAAGILVRESGF